MKEGQNGNKYVSACFMQMCVGCKFIKRKGTLLGGALFVITANSNASCEELAIELHSSAFS